MQEISKESVKIYKAMALIGEYGMIDGVHHKQWLIDQILRVLSGNDYEYMINDYNSNNYEWDTGIAP